MTILSHHSNENPNNNHIDCAHLNLSPTIEKGCVQADDAADQVNSPLYLELVLTGAQGRVAYSFSSASETPFIGVQNVLHGRSTGRLCAAAGVAGRGGRRGHRIGPPLTDWRMHGNKRRPLQPE